MLCNKCGQEVENNAKFCKVCGNNLINNIQVNSSVNSNQNNNYEQVNNISKEKNGLAIASLVMGIISVVLSFIINIFIFPIAIIGLVLGIVNKNKCGQKTAGIILNCLSMVIAIIILVSIGLVLGFAVDLYNDYTNYNPVNGVWNCKSFSGAGIGDDYIITMKLNDDDTFIWNKYGDELNNHVYGSYTYKDEHKTNNSGDYKYYMIDLVGEEFVNNGILQTQDYKSQYEMGINDEKGEAILMNVTTYNMYYCYLYTKI